METHILQYDDLEITIQVNDLDANSYIQYFSDGMHTRYEAKGIEVNKLAKEANTNFAKILKDSAGKIIKSTIGMIPAVLPFEYFAYSTVEIPMYEAIDKKMLNGLMMTYFGVSLFSPDGVYVEPLDFRLYPNAGPGFTIDYYCGSYTDQKYCYRENGEGMWSPWYSGTEQTGLTTGTMYEVKATSPSTVLNYDPVHQITI